MLLNQSFWSIDKSIIVFTLPLYYPPVVTEESTMYHHENKNVDLPRARGG